MTAAAVRAGNGRPQAAGSGSYIDMYGNELTEIPPGTIACAYCDLLREQATGIEDGETNDNGWWCRRIKDNKFVDFEGEIRYNCSITNANVSSVRLTPRHVLTISKGYLQMATSKNTSNIPYGYCQCGCGLKTPLQSNGNRRNYHKGHAPRVSSEELFWSKFLIPDDPDECWEWQGGRHARGYGQFLQKKAHRVMWELIFGEIPDGLEVCHGCDNPPCCNPSHLWLGTHSENMQDCKTKGRYRPVSTVGEKNHSTKLTEVDVLRIRSDHALGGGGYRVFARKYGIDPGTVRDIIKRITWKHI